ncbi:hypothetical protein [Caulobacter sp. 1776]|uniref:hypothetical protein n=1 Tax=Caulobacter sp. 1776 TaxID=3156420 RepID=UPI003394E022
MNSIVSTTRWTLALLGHRRLLILVVLALGLTMALQVALAVLMAGESLPALHAARSLGLAADPAALVTLSAKVAPYRFASFVLNLSVTTLLLCAAYRAALGLDGGAPGVRISPDEARLLGANLATGALCLAVYFVAVVICTLTATATLGLGGLRLLVTGQVSDPGRVWPVAVAALLAAVVCAYVWSGFLLSGVRTIQTGRVAVFSAWPLMKGQRVVAILSGLVLAGPLVLAAALVAPWATGQSGLAALGDMFSLAFVDTTRWSAAFAVNTVLVISGLSLLKAIGLVLGVGVAAAVNDRVEGLAPQASRDLGV